MKTSWLIVRVTLLTLILAGLSGCSDPHVYGSIGVSSGYSSYGGYGRGGWGGPGLSTSISIGGRIH